MQFKTLLFDIQDHVAHITLNRPEVANAINLELAKELMEATFCCDEDPLIRAVLISGKGSMFCVGGDLKSFSQQKEKLSYYLKEITTYLHAALSSIVRMDPPFIAAVHGVAAGAGLSIACACDVALAAKSTKFSMAYSKVGLSPDGGSTYILPRLVGVKRTLELALTNRTLTAQEALDWGMVTKIVEEEHLLSEAKALATRLAKGPTRAFGLTKRLVLSGLKESFEAQLKSESSAIAEMAGSIDGQEGINAFLEKRSPNFRGK